MKYLHVTLGLVCLVLGFYFGFAHTNSTRESLEYLALSLTCFASTGQWIDQARRQ